jgi:hypothetical protein
MSISKESYEERQATKTKLEELAAECQAAIKSLDECGKHPLVAECDRLNDELRDVLYNSTIGRKARPWAFIILEAADPAEATRLWGLIHANPGAGNEPQAVTLAPVYAATKTERLA